MKTDKIPKQRISKSAKTKSWGKLVVDELESITASTNHNGRSSKFKKQTNYDLFNGILNREDFEYVISPLGVNQGEYPANLQHYDQISPKIQLLLGEEMKRPFNMRVVSRNPDAVTDFEEKQKELIFKALEASIQTGGSKDPNMNPPQLSSPKAIAEYMSSSYQDIREIAGQQALTYLIDEQKLRLKFNDGFKDALVSAETIFYVGEVGGEPSVRLCNPIDISVIKDPDSDFVEDALAVTEERWLTMGTLMDEYWKELTPSEISKLEKDMGRSGEAKGSDLNYPEDRIIIRGENDFREANSNVSAKSDSENTIRVLHCQWVSMRKIGILTSDGEDIIVDEEFDVPEVATKSGNKFIWSDEDQISHELEWYWINEVWECDKIGSEIYTKPRAVKNQRRSLDNPCKVKLGYVGYIYNNRNSESVSMIDRMRPYQYLYNIIYYRTELALAKSKGKLALMDIAQIPSSEGWDVDKWMYYLESMGVMFINSHEEGKNGQPSQFNQFQSIDLSMGNYINTHVQLLDKISEEIGEISGVSRQRQGQVQTSELVGNTERAVVQSSHITEPWFYYHGEVKKRVLEALIDVAKVCWRDGKKINYIMDDMTRLFFTIDGSEFDNTEYGVFVTDSSKDDRIKQTIEQLSHAALQGGSISMSDIVDILQTESIQDSKRRLENAERKQREFQKELEAQKGKQALDLQREAQSFEREKEDREDARNTEDNRTKLEIAYISKNKEAEDNSLLDERRLDLQERKMSNDQVMAEKELELKKNVHNDKMEREDKKISINKKTKEATK